MELRDAKCPSLGLEGQNEKELLRRYMHLCKIKIVFIKLICHWIYHFISIKFRVYLHEKEVFLPALLLGGLPGPHPGVGWET